MWKISFHMFICSTVEDNFPQKQNSIVLQMNMWKNVFHVFGGSQLSMENCFPLKKMEDCFPFSHEFVLNLSGYYARRRVSPTFLCYFSRVNPGYEIFLMLLAFFPAIVLSN